jgi:hypothetical protein
MYLFAPLGKHYDDGLGALGDAFRDAAETLRKANGNGVALASWEHLPETFLLRHAIELYLKSGILIIHRRLRLRYDLEPHTSPKPMLLTSAGRWESLFKTHDLARLYWYWKKLIVDNEAKLMSLITPPLDDMSVPHELNGWIGTLSNIDPAGDYLRYPVSRNTAADSKKSPFKEVAPNELFPPTRKNGEYVTALLVEGPKGEVVRAFKYDKDAHKDVAEAARQAAEMLSNYHAMMRFGLTGGW